MPRRTYTYEAGLGWEIYNQIETVGGFVIALSVLAFLVNVIYTQVRGPRASSDPWDGRSLEWSIPSPPPEYNFAEIPRVEARDDWWHRKYTEDADGRLVRLPAGGSVDDAEADAAKADADAGSDVEPSGNGHVSHTHAIHMPSPSFYPLIVAAGLPFLGYAAVFLNVWLLIPGLLLLTFGIYAWALEPSTEPEVAH
jgi:cytochrome c oxidase subunit 1